VAKRVRTLLVRTAHPTLRRRARAALEGAPPVGRILFVCLGNVCRSPYAEYRMRELLAERGSSDALTVESAGFIKPGRGSPERAVEVASERGLDLTGHVSRVLETCSVDRRTLVVVMEPGQVKGVRQAFGGDTAVLVLGDLDPELPDRRLIPDPWGHEPAVFRSSFDRVDRCLDELLPLLGLELDAPGQAWR